MTDNKQYGQPQFSQAPETPDFDATTHMQSQFSQAPRTFSPDATVNMMPNFPQAPGTPAPNHTAAHMPPQTAMPGQAGPWQNPAPPYQAPSGQANHWQNPAPPYQTPSGQTNHWQNPAPPPYPMPGAAEQWQNPAPPYQTPSGQTNHWQNPAPMYQTPPPYADNTYSSMPYPPNGSYSAPKPNKGKLIAILGICGGVLAIGIVILILVLTNGNKGSNGSGGGGGGNNGEISTQSSIVGTWEDGSGGYTFNGDGTGSTFTFGGDGSVKFNYTINGDNITIRVEEDNFNFTSGYSVSGNTLTLNYPDGRTAKYNKKDTSANNNNNTGTADPALLVGTWEYSMDEDFALCYIFNADNTGTFIFVGDEMPMTYETNGNKLACTISYSGSYTKVDEYTYSISGDTLSLTDLEYGLTMKYTKK